MNLLSRRLQLKCIYEEKLLSCSLFSEGKYCVEEISFLRMWRKSDESDSRISNHSYFTFLLLFASTKGTKKPRSFWSSDCSVLPLMLTSFSMLRKVALQSTMREHVLVYFKYRQCLVCLQVLSITKNPSLKNRQNISHKHSKEYWK